MLATPALRRRWRVLAPSLLIVLALPATASAQAPEPEATPTVSAPDIRPADDPSRPVEDHVEVLGATETSAKLSVSKGCVKTGTVDGSAIRSVAFTLDGRRLRTVTRTTVRLGRVKRGSHKLVAEVAFRDGTSTTLTRRVSGCA
jgi:hypothetical protein